MAISRASIPLEQVEPLREAVTCSIGDVDVQSMDLPQLAAFLALRRRLSVPLDGETEDETNARVMVGLLPHVLSICVVADDGEPVYTEKQWGRWCGRHIAEANNLFAVAMNVCGVDQGQQKKT